mmetsp:Transcript_20964/g.29530  ORF Transcript_20964/g.29530 Transcript_20964/m.29530 type:complete len:293 (+) Transcript_20964:27-905(+)|eukprot:CAMPEP_0175104160 /NCGR_PEP_ID=MMETSP0086_2-20121207/9541_1 /TAXON_ID=136419 /ORGANISM="Unknown Unknown, Strain D1" /LENGTH=292 /DNA_ID=CAMNT_0016379457 /DNA_START=27 /DNA_END=905 /DNA_ORIENTATION=-
MATILVTGANSGIGFALCKQLVATPHKCRVLLGARSKDKGLAAVKEVLTESPEAKIDFVEIDVSNDESVCAAAEAVKKLLGDAALSGIVNNAGTGLAHKGVTAKDIVNVNYYGPRRVVNSFLPLLDQKAGRIVNVGSGAGPMYVNKRKTEPAALKVLTSWQTTLPELDSYVEKTLAGFDVESKDDTYASYGLSKAALSVYTMCLAKQFKEAKTPILASCLSPGFIATNIVSGFGATKKPEEGTVSIRHCLFNKLEGNGFYYGSDAVRSPLTQIRNPGEPPYTGDEEEKKYQM